MQIFYTIMIAFLMVSCGEPRYEKFDNVENDERLNPKDGDPKETMKMSSNRSNNQIGTGISFETVKKQILEKIVLAVTLNIQTTQKYSMLRTQF